MSPRKDEARASATQGSGPGRQTAPSRKKWESGDGAKVGARLRASGLRPTRQRTVLAGLLFRGGDRHVSAEMLHAEAARAGLRVSLATVYNTLHQFTEVGLLRQVVVDASRGYFDTNIAEHQHFYCADAGTLIDIPGNDIEVVGLPAAPKGTAVERIDVIVRLKRI